MSAGLLFYCISTATEFIIEAGGLNIFVYRLWYLTGAIYVAAYIAAGAVYSILPKNVRNPSLILLVLASLYAAITIFTFPIDITGMNDLTTGLLPMRVRIISPFFNIAAVAAILIACFYELYLLLKKSGKVKTMISFFLITAGMLLPGIGGVALRAGMSTSIYFYVLELLGLIILYVGILVGHVLKANYWSMGRNTHDETERYANEETT
ncbi:MAG: hypothetical protein PHG36_01180 [Dehalococcoidia bacterium]|nr:hypothetical protein [Dehalococcoidia bacterium]